MESCSPQPLLWGLGPPNEACGPAYPEKGRGGGQPGPRAHPPSPAGGAAPHHPPPLSLQGELLSPCRCDGSVKCTHQPCLIKWISERGCWSCELCYYKYHVIAISTKNPLQVPAALGVGARGRPAGISTPSAFWREDGFTLESGRFGEKERDGSGGQAPEWQTGSRR